MDKSSQKLETFQSEPALEHGSSTEYHELERKYGSPPHDRRVRFLLTTTGWKVGTFNSLLLEVPSVLAFSLELAVP